MTVDAGADRPNKARQRDPYKEVGAAMREARDRLLKVPRTVKTARYREIVWYLIVEVGSYSWISHEERKKKVASVFGVSEKTVQRALDWASENGVIRWGPGSNGGGWVVGLPSHEPAETVLTPQDISSADMSSPPGHFEQASVQTYEKTHEKKYEKTLAPCGVRPTGPTGPIKVEGAPPAEELLLPTGDGDGPVEVRRRQLAAVALAMGGLSQIPDEAHEQVVRQVDGDCDPAELLAAVSDPERSDWFDPAPGWVGDMLHVVAIADGLKTNSKIKPAEVVSLTDQVQHLWSDPEERRQGLGEAATWDEKTEEKKTQIMHPAQALAGRFSKKAQEMAEGRAERCA